MMGTLRLKAPPPPTALAAVARAAGDSLRVAPPPRAQSPAQAAPAAASLTKAESKALAKKLHTSRLATKSVRLPIIARAVWFSQKVEMAAAAEQQIAWRMEDLARCRELYPAAFDMDRPLPLTCGVHKTLAPLLGTKRAHRLLDWWVNSPLYLVAIAAGGHRHTLEGKPAEPISDAHREKAQARIARLKRDAA